MKNILLCMCTAFALFVAAAVAQTTDNSSRSQGTAGSSPSMSQQPSAAPDTTQGGVQGNSTTSNGNMNSTGTMKMDKKMKGCIQSQGGQYVLQTKHGKDISLTGQDVSAHVGHEVAVYGTWAGASANMSGSDTMSNGGNMSTNSSGGNSGGGMMSGKSFNVTSVDMISETCSKGK